MKFALIFSLFIAIIPVISMERETDLQALPDPAAIIVVASCENKNALRQTCKRFSQFASRRKNENILIQPQLYLTQEALDHYLIYYGALGNVAIVRNLLAKGANPNVCEDNGETLMHYAVRCGYDDIVKMLSEHPDLIKHDFSSIKRPTAFNGIERDQFGKHLCSGCASKPEELLHNVIKQGWYEAVEYLLAHNVSANAKNKKGESALYCAAQEGYLNIMKLLIKNGACVNDSVCDAWHEVFPLKLAVNKGYTSVVQLLIDNDGNVNAYLWEQICERGYIKIFKIVLSQRMNIKDPALLLITIKKGHIQMVKILLEKGADVNATQSGNSDGYKSLDFARNNEDMQKLLIAYGATERDNCILQ